MRSCMGKAVVLLVGVATLAIGAAPVAYAADGVELGTAGVASTKATADVEQTVSQQELDGVYDQLKTPYKQGLIEFDGFDQTGLEIDCASVYRSNGRWYMSFVSVPEGAIGDQGYTTHLAVSDNLRDWKYVGIIFQNEPKGTADRRLQSAAFPALEDTTWGGSYELEQVDGKYWFSTMEGTVGGYEGEPMNIGLLSTTDPTDPAAFAHEDGLLLTTKDADASVGETAVLYRSNIIHDPAKTTGYEYVMYYNARNKDRLPGYGTPIERLFMAGSNDMKTWTRIKSTEPAGDLGAILVLKDSAGKPLRITGDPQVVKMGDLWVINVFSYENSSAFDTFAVSKDLIHWTPWNGTPTVEKSADKNAPDSKHAHKPWIVKDENGAVYHFYTARSKASARRGIALATNTDFTNKVAPAISGVKNEVSVEYGSQFDPMAGVSATDDQDGDVKVTVSVTFDGDTVDKVDTTRPGIYTLTYRAADREGNIATATSTVTVGESPTPEPSTDTTAPTFAGIKDATIDFGTHFNPLAGVSATDDRDGDITAGITVTGAVDTSKAGTYTLVYTVSDAAGNTAEAKRTITVKAKAGEPGDQVDKDQAGKDQTGDGQELSRTGSSIAVVAAVFAALLTAGLTLRSARRKRRD